MAVVFFRQVRTLIAKNLRIVLVRHPVATVVRALVIPLALLVFFSYAKYLFVPAAVYGIGTARPLMSLPAALKHAATTTGRETVVFFNGGFAGGAIDGVIDSLAPVVQQAGSKVVHLQTAAELDEVCRSSLRGVTRCFGAVLFSGSPTEGTTGGIWSYTVRLDGALGAGKIHVNQHTNDGEVYGLPLQHAVDAAIVATSNSSSTALSNVYEYPFTSLTAAERDDKIRVRYQRSLTSFLGVAFVSGVIGICYHLTGFVATERETGMATLLDAMMTTSASGRRWGEAQIARMVSYHVAFSLLYLPGWVVGSAVVAASVFSHSNAAVVILYHVLVGLALASMSLAGASLFRRAQLSGVMVTLVYLLLAILAQVVSQPSTATVAVLSLLFAPCNYVYFVTNVARFERHETAASLARVAPSSPWRIPLVVLWVFLAVQIVAYPVLGFYVERYLHGTLTTGRTIVTRAAGSDAGAVPALQLDQFSKTYSAGPLRRAVGWLVKPRAPVQAVRELTLTAGRGQILVLLGANGSGKSTTLDAIAGTSKLTGGRITIDGTGGLGIAPQKNVLWDELTVEEHLRIFNRLKAPLQPATRAATQQLIAAVDLAAKAGARAKTLSGGQQRKLQLGMMLTGGSAVCCVDEVSSGLDPLSRRKIWDILLAERGRRTIIMTTHFLDEADLLSDHIAVLSKGTLRAAGSSAALKDALGGGYRIHVPKTTGAAKAAAADLPDIDGVVKKDAFDLVTYVAPSSSLAARVIRALEAVGVGDYRFSGPTLEDVFLQLAEEVQDPAAPEKGHSKTASESVALVDGPGSSQPTIVATSSGTSSGTNSGTGLKLLSGQRIGYWQQARVLFGKRVTVCKSSWFASFAALVIPVAAAGLVTLFVRHQSPPGCSTAAQSSNTQPETLADASSLIYLVAGPRSRFTDLSSLLALLGPMFGTTTTTTTTNSSSSSSSTAIARLLQNITLADTYDDFAELVVRYRRNITPAGLWLGDGSSPPTLAYLGDYIDQVNGFYGQNFLDALLGNVSIAASYAAFDVPWSPDMGKSLQLLVYVALACSAYPGFFALYPNLERRRHVRSLEYSNGVRALPLWLAYVAFDAALVLASSALATILFAALSGVWYHVGYLFIVFALYGLASALLAYVISLFSRNQLSAYAFTAASQAVVFLVYMIAYLCTITYAPVNKIDADLLVVHFVVSAIAPIGSVVRSLFIALNLFSTACDGSALSARPGGITLYGGPILYLVLQAVALFGLLLWFDSGRGAASLHQLARKLRRGRPAPAADAEGAERQDAETEEVTGLHVDHVTKTFGRNTVVDNVSFGVGRGEVFALLGPNGAGKSTTISMIRGDLKPDDGDVRVEGASVTRRLAAARASLGVCPQFDAVDQMTVREHLCFYARVRGIADVAHNVAAVLQAVGLAAFRDRPAHALSGGNKRKLSLGIALMGNPAVLLLDEPSSGLDAAAKRIMWKTLAAAATGRSILLTTHSMEEADALAGRAGILAKRMLAAGDTDALRARFGRRLYVHLVCRGAPHTPDAVTARLRAWVQTAFSGADIEDKTYHGQMRFAVPVHDGQLVTVDAVSEKALLVPQTTGSSETLTNAETLAGTAPPTPTHAPSAVGRLVVLLDEQRVALGIDHFSVSPTTLDQVFLAIVGQHNVQEEGYQREAAKKKWKFHF